MPVAAAASGCGGLLPGAGRAALCFVVGVSETGLTGLTADLAIVTAGIGAAPLEDQVCVVAVRIAWGAGNKGGVSCGVLDGEGVSGCERCGGEENGEGGGQ